MYDEISRSFRFFLLDVALLLLLYYFDLHFEVLLFHLLSVFLKLSFD